MVVLLVGMPELNRSPMRRCGGRLLPHRAMHKFAVLVAACMRDENEMQRRQTLAGKGHGASEARDEQAQTVRGPCGHSAQRDVPHGEGEINLGASRACTASAD